MCEQALVSKCALKSCLVEMGVKSTHESDLSFDTDIAASCIKTKRMPEF